ncbi:MAG: sulfatase, partial [Polyangiaceae bacterium]
VPTMLDLMGLPKPSGEGDDFLSGQSWMPDWFSEPTSRPVLVDMPAGPYNGARRAFIKDDLKLILLRGGQKKELYDLSDDPGETRNVWSTRKEEIEAHYALMKRQLKEIEVTGKFK